MPTELRPRSALLAAVLALLGSPPALAHIVSTGNGTNNIYLRPGGRDWIYVQDQLDCKAIIQLTSHLPQSVEVCLVDAVNGVTSCGAVAVSDPQVFQVFEVRASNDPITIQQTAVIEVCWIGQGTSPTQGYACDENNCVPPAPDFVYVNVVPDAGTSAAIPSSGSARDPVNTASGELFLEEAADLALGGPMPLVLDRYYASRLAQEGSPGTDFGPNWLHSFSWRLTQVGHNVEIFTDRGRVIRFEKQGYYGTSWESVLYQDVPFQLVQNGPFWMLADPRDGRVYFFDPSGLLSMVTDGHGNNHFLSYIGPDLASVTDFLGRTLTFTRDGLGRITAVSDGSRTVTYGYTAGNLTAFTDAAGKTTTYAYDSTESMQARLVSRTLPNGNTPYTQVFDATGKVTQQSDAFANTFELSYGATTTIEDPLGSAIGHTHSDESELTAFTDETGKSASLGYDPKERRDSVQDRMGGTTAWTFHEPSGQVATRTEADGAVTAQTYSLRTFAGLSLYDLAARTRVDGTSEAFARDPMGNLLSWTDPAGEVWSWIYGPDGLPLSATNPASGTSAFTWNPDRTLATAKEPDGHTTSIAYDPLKRPIQVTHPDGKARSLSWTQRSEVASETDELGNARQFGYDDNGNLTQVLDRTGAPWTTAYDAMDRPTAHAGPLGHPTSIHYDAFGRPSALVQPDGAQILLGYDVRGFLVLITDTAGEVWSLGCNDEGVPSSITTPLGHATAIASDPLGRPVSWTDPLNAVWQVTRDALGRPTALIEPGGATTAITYEERGLVESVALPSATGTASYAYDGLGQPTSEVDSNGGAWTRIYDSEGKLTWCADPLGRTTAFAYDNRDRVVQKAFPGGLGSVTYTYDAASRMTRALYSDGTDHQYVHDKESRLLSGTGFTLVRDAAGRIIESNGIGVGYDSSDRISSVTYAPSKAVTYEYGANGLVSGIHGWLGWSIWLDYDADRQLVSISRPNGVKTTLVWDDAGRLVSLRDGALASVELERDALGQVTQARRRQPLQAVPALDSQSFAYDAAHQVQGWSYDALGNLLGDGERTLTWNLARQLTSIQSAAGGGAISLDWDALSSLTCISDSGGSRQLVRNYAFSVPVVSTVRLNSTDHTYVVSLPGGTPIATIDAQTDQASFLHLDESRNVIFVSDAGGAVVEARSYDPKGKVLAHTGGSTVFNYQGGSGAVDLGAGDTYAMNFGRVYDVRLGRFVTLDESTPQAVIAGTNAYIRRVRDGLLGMATLPYEDRASHGRPSAGRDRGFGPRTQVSPQGLPVINAPTISLGSQQRGLGSDWSSCQSCHTQGLSDEVTWAFADPTGSLPPPSVAQRFGLGTPCSARQAVNQFGSSGLATGLASLRPAAPCDTTATTQFSVGWEGEFPGAGADLESFETEAGAPGVRESHRDNSRPDNGINLFEFIFGLGSVPERRYHVSLRTGKRLYH